MARVVLAGVGKRYADGTHAVQDLTLEIEDGEFLVLVGPSGCGKSTALRMIAGLEDISEGAVLIEGTDVSGVPSRDRDVAMVFQSYALYPHLNVYDNIAFGLTLRKMPKTEIDSRVREAAKILDLHEQLDRKPRNLSGGQRQRVAMGRAIVRQPRVFLMDEPLSNLDAKLRVQMRAEIARLQRDLSVTTIYVTHDQTEAMTLGDRVAVMKRGVLQQVGAPQELYDRPVNLFVAGFIGSPGMNLVTAEVQFDVDGKAAVLVGGQRLELPASTLSARPALRERDGQQVVLGIRPEDMEDAALAGAGEGCTLRSVADLVEAMGSDVLVHFPMAAAPIAVEDMAAARTLDPVLPGGTASTVLVGRFSPRTTAFEGQSVEIRVDTSRMHFFDPVTGDSIWHT